MRQFYDVFMKVNKLEPRPGYHDKRQKDNIIARDIVTKINVDSESTAIDRLYGGRCSLRQWDLDRKKKSFETVPEAKKRSADRDLKVSAGLKEVKNHVGNFSSYRIDTSPLKNLDMSWSTLFGIKLVTHM